MPASRNTLPLADKYEFAMDTILRTTPALLGLFSIVALCAHELSKIAKAQIKDSPMVSKSGSHLQRCHRGGTPRNMSTSDFFHVTTPPRQDALTNQINNRNCSTSAIVHASFCNNGKYRHASVCATACPFDPMSPEACRDHNMHVGGRRRARHHQGDTKGG